MKKIIFLTASILVLLSFCTPVLAFTDSEAMESAKHMVREAKISKDDGCYADAGNLYSFAGTSFSQCHRFHELAAYVYGLAADAYDMDNWTENADDMRECQAEQKEKALKYGDQVPVSEVFNGDTLIEATGATLSEGNVTIIVGVAGAVIFALGGYFLGMRKGKKSVQ